MDPEVYRMSPIPEESSLMNSVSQDRESTETLLNKKTTENGLKSPNSWSHQKTHSQQLTSDTDTWSVVIPEDIFKIKNLDTGEEIDIRDENQETFPGQVVKIFNLQGNQEDLEDFYKQKRKMNNSLWEAVERNDINRCKELLDRELYGDMVAQTNTKGLNDWTALHLAAADGFKDAIEVLIFHGERTNVDSRTSMQRTPLHLACLHGHLPVVKILVREGADINAIDNELSTPLHYAAKHGHELIVKWLLGRIPDISIKNNLGKTAVDLALNIDVYSAFREHCNRFGLSVPHTEYGRNPFYSVLRRTSRQDMVDNLILKSSHKPSNKDLQTFKERPKLQATPKKSIKKTQSLNKGIVKPPDFGLPPCKVGPRDFKGLLQLGKGSFGEVYLVEKIDSGEQFALKVLRKEKVLENNLIRYAFAERNILMKIKHPYIVKLNYAFQTPEKLVMIMDYCPGGDLGTHLAREKHFNEEKARFYICEILLGLEELHKHEIIFRDLKPENVVLDADGHARITDFGLSKEGVTEGQLAKSFCGSVAYLAPEMLRRSGHTKSVDWYLLGVLLYEMLVGAPPYYSSNREQLFNNIQRGKLKIPKGLSNEAKDIIKLLLNRDPHKRLGASKRDAAEIKEHAFFRGVNWDAYARKEIKAPEIRPIKRVIKGVGLERMFGRLEDEEIQAPRLDGWSFITPS
ncbi:unnamed protein product [Blepharisma stoltei]|uniref:Protein kinase domain-containing protein n=1 Tax=Blepharisma stoltei TaxID=1481888 RepID=A0AAU9ITH8_9CILI|nr:unnamed protein product [Blepharisma stoltei]